MRLGSLLADYSFMGKESVALYLVSYKLIPKLYQNRACIVANLKVRYFVKFFYNLLGRGLIDNLFVGPG